MLCYNAKSKWLFYWNDDLIIDGKYFSVCRKKGDCEDVQVELECVEKKVRMRGSYLCPNMRVYKLELECGCGCFYGLWRFVRAEWREEEKNCNTQHKINISRTELLNDGNKLFFLATKNESVCYISFYSSSSKREKRSGFFLEGLEERRGILLPWLVLDFVGRELVFLLTLVDFFFWDGGVVVFLALSFLP